MWRLALRMLDWIPFVGPCGRGGFALIDDSCTAFGAGPGILGADCPCIFKLTIRGWWMGRPYFDEARSHIVLYKPSFSIYLHAVLAPRVASSLIYAHVKIVANVGRTLPAFAASLADILSISFVLHNDPLPNGCHKTRNVPWPATLPEQNSLCLTLACVCQRHCLCAAHWATSLPEWCWDETQRRWQSRQSLACFSSTGSTWQLLFSSGSHFFERCLVLLC